MDSSKLLHLLRSFAPKEWVGCERHLKGLHPKKKVAIQVFDYLQQRRKNLKGKTMDKVYAFQKIFPNEKYNYDKITNGMSDLVLIIEDFLICQKAREDGFKKEYARAKIYKSRKLEGYYQQQLTQLRNQLQAPSAKTYGIWLPLYLLQIEQHEYYSSSNLKFKKDQINNAMHYLDAFYFTTKLRYSSEIYSRHFFLKEELPSIQLVEHSLKNIESSNPSIVLIHSIYYHILLMIKDKEKEEGHSFFIVKNILLEHFTDLGIWSKSIICGYLINYTARKIREGKDEYYQEAFSLYKISLKHQLIIVDGHIEPAQFSNIVNIACHAEQYVWAEDFVKKWESALHQMHKTGIVKLAQARIWLETQQYQKVEKIVETYHPTEVLYSIQLRMIKLILYFETNHSPKWLLSQSFTFKKYLRDHKKLNSSFTAGWINFLTIFDKIVRQRSKKEIQKSIVDYSVLVNKKWLLKKVATMH